MCCSLCILCSFRTAPTTTTMWGACGQKRAGTRRACRADVQQRDRAHGAGRRGEPHCLTVQMLASQWVWQKSVIILAEEQNAGRVVDYFYRMEFHITPRFFSDSNYLFVLWCVIFSHFLWGNGIGGVIYWVEIGEIKPQVKYTPTNHYSNPKLGQNFTRESVVPPLVPFGHSKSTHRFESEIICTTALYMGEIFLETQNRILDPHRCSKVSNSGFVWASALAKNRKISKKKFFFFGKISTTEVYKMAQKIQGKPSIGQIMKKNFKSNF